MSVDALAESLAKKKLKAEQNKNTYQNSIDSIELSEILVNTKNKYYNEINEKNCSKSNDKLLMNSIKKHEDNKHASVSPLDLTTHKLSNSDRIVNLLNKGNSDKIINNKKVSSEKKNRKLFS